MKNFSDRIFFGAIADDFSGASDLATHLAKSGAPVSLRFGVDGLTNDTFVRPFEVIAIKCRTAPVDDAIAEALQAYRWLKSKGAERYFWKYCSTFDSTSKGNIGPVAEALMAEIGTTQTIYCPAFPENGRSIYAGHLYVGEQLLSDSSMKDHPLTPMHDSNLMRLLEPQTDRAVGLIHYRAVKKGLSAVREELKSLAVKNVSHVVVDAIDDEHLSVIAGACQNMPLITGGSALAQPLPRLYQKADHVKFGEAPVIYPGTDDACVALAGSCSEMTRRQIEHFSRKHEVFKLYPIKLATDEDHLETAKDWLMAQPLSAPKLIFASADPQEVARNQEVLGRDKAGEVVEEALGELAKQSVELGMRRIIAAGGETSGAIIKALGITSVDVGPEIAPGVPWVFANLGVESAALALKSGNFGEEDFFSKAFEMLD